MINRSSAGAAAPESAVPEPAGRKIPGDQIGEVAVQHGSGRWRHYIAESRCWHEYMNGTQSAAKKHSEADEHTLLAAGSFLAGRENAAPPAARWIGDEKSDALGIQIIDPGQARVILSTVRERPAGTCPILSAVGFH